MRIDTYGTIDRECLVFDTSSARCLPSCAILPKVCNHFQITTFDMTYTKQLSSESESTQKSYMRRADFA